MVIDIDDIASFDILLSNNINFYTLAFILLVCICFVLFLLLQANLLNLSFYPNSTFDAEKYSPYECGFTPFWTERAQFDIKFYLVALLFLVFDVELMFLLPYSLSYYYLGFFGYVIFLLFFSILVIGFLVEWAVGMLVWKGEEESPMNVFFAMQTERKIRTAKRSYFSFVKNYLCLFDYKSIVRKFWRYSLVDKSFLVWKIKLRKPYYYKYYAQQPRDYFPWDLLDFIDFDDTGVFINLWFKVPCYGAWTVALSLELYKQEWKLWNDWIVRLLTAMFGEPFIKYYNKLPKYAKESFGD